MINEQLMNFDLITFSVKDISHKEIKEYETALKFFNFKFFEQASILFGRLRLQNMANM